MTDALFIGAFVAFMAVMFGFVFLYDRSVASSECDAPETSPKTGRQEESGSITA